MKDTKLLRHASERPTWLPVQVKVGDAAYRVYPSGTVYRVQHGTLSRMGGSDAEFVLLRALEAQSVPEV